MAKSLFDHVNAIFTDQSVSYFDDLTEEDSKSFVPYMINRCISMNTKYIDAVSLFSRNFEFVGPRETYLFYSQLLPRGKSYSKYIKAEKQDTYDEWLLSLISRYFRVSLKEAEEYCDLCFQTDDGKAELRLICEKYGIEPKQIKKAKLC